VPSLTWYDRLYHVGGDDTLLYYLHPWAVIQHFAVNIVGDNALSSVGGYGQQLYLVPFVAALGVLRWVAPFANTQSLAFGLNLAGAFLAMRMLLGEIFGRDSDLAGVRTAVAIAYALAGPAVYTVWQTQLFAVYALSIVPLALAMLLRGVRTKQVGWAAATALVLSVFSVLIFALPWLVPLLACAIPVVVVTAWPDRRVMGRHLGVFLGLLLVLNAYWLVPQFAPVFLPQDSNLTLTPQVRGGADDELIVRSVAEGNSPLYPLLGEFHRQLQRNYNWTQYRVYRHWNERLLVLHLPVFVLMALGIAVRSVVRRTVAGVAALSWLTTVYFFGPDIGSWGLPLFVWLTGHVPGFVMFRNMYDKFGPAVALSGAMVLAVALVGLAGRGRAAVGWRRIAIGGVAALALVEGVPFLAGAFFREPITGTKHTYPTVRELNADYFALTKELSTRPRAGRVAWLPLNAANYVQISDVSRRDHVYSGVSPLLFFAGRSDLSGRLSFPGGGQDIIDALLRRDAGYVGEQFRRYGVRYVVVNHDISSDLIASNFFSSAVAGDLFAAQVEGHFVEQLAGEKLGDFGSRYTLYEIADGFRGDIVSVAGGDGIERPSDHVEKRAAWRYTAEVTVNDGDRVRLREPANRWWTLRVRGGGGMRTVRRPADRAVNEWEVEAVGGPQRVALEFVFVGQRMVTPLATVSSLALVLTLAWFVRSGRRRRRVAQAPS
jgi:hypothetical protein